MQKLISQREIGKASKGYTFSFWNVKTIVVCQLGPLCIWHRIQILQFTRGNQDLLVIAEAHVFSSVPLVFCKSLCFTVHIWQLHL